MTDDELARTLDLDMRLDEVHRRRHVLGDRTDIEARADRMMLDVLEDRLRDEVRALRADDATD